MRSGAHRERQERHVGSVRNRSSGQSEKKNADNAPRAQSRLERKILFVSVCVSPPDNIAVVCIVLFAVS